MLSYLAPSGVVPRRVTVMVSPSEETRRTSVKTTFPLIMPEPVMVCSSTRFNEIISMPEELLLAVEATTLHGDPVSGQLNVKSPVEPSPSVAKAVDLRPLLPDSIRIVASMKTGAPDV